MRCCVPPTSCPDSRWSAPGAARMPPSAGMDVDDEQPTWHASSTDTAIGAHSLITCEPAFCDRQQQDSFLQREARGAREVSSNGSAPEIVNREQVPDELAQLDDLSVLDAHAEAGRV